jgi:transcriptional regulator with XRE-family HTH domain
MSAPKPNPEAGKQLRAARLRVRLSTREVESLSRRFAEKKNNHEYCISHAWLTDVENGEFTPGPYKLSTLSHIYNFNCFKAFGIEISQAGKQILSPGLPRTHLVGGALEEAAQTISAPTELRDQVQFEQTNLVARMFQSWGEIPVGLLPQMNLQNSLCGYIGLEDYTLYPLIRPGSFVHIDARQKKIKTGTWRNEFDRPIYFVELRNGYVCSYCELDGSQLLLLPCPQSGIQVRHVRYPGEAEVVGRVTAVSMSIAGMPSRPGDSKGR